MITDLHVDSFEGIKHFQEGIKENVVLIAGANGAGKSSLRDAIRMALFNGADRVRLKKHWHKLVHDGAKRALVEMRHAHGINRAEIYGVGTNRYEGEQPPASLVYTTGALHFAKLPDDHKRSLLLDWGKVDMSAEQIEARLLARNVNPQFVELIKPFLKSGFEAAQTEAKDRAKLAKIHWRGITGETYGELKADNWQAPGVEMNIKRLGEVQNRLADLVVEMNPLETAVEQADQDAKQRGRYSNRIETLTRLSKDYQQRSGLVALAKKERDDKQEYVDQLNIELNQALSAAETPPMPCPCCNEQLVLFMGRLVKADSLKPDAEKAARLQAELDQATYDARLLHITLVGREKEAAESVRATQELAILNDSLPPPPNPRKIQRQRLRLKELMDERLALNNELTELENAGRINEQCKEETQKAMLYHQEALDWTRIADLLSPDGIPSDFLSEALRPFNAFLVEMQEAGLTGLVQVKQDLSITFNGREYDLLCESEQWRTDAMLAAAIGAITGNRFVLLDRMDVLGVQERGSVLNWAKWLGKHDFQVWLFATLKQKPGSIEGIQSFWLSHGSVLR